MQPALGDADALLQPMTPAEGFQSMKLIAATALLVALALPVAAQQTKCGSLVGVSQVLSVRFGESVIAQVEVDHPKKPGEKIIIEIWANAARTSWTLTGTVPVDGVMCIIDAGRGAPPPLSRFFDKAV